MKTIFCLEVIDKDETVLIKYPFDILQFTDSEFTINEFKALVSGIPDRLDRLATETRLHFILNMWHNDNVIRVGSMNWKYDESYYANLKTSTSKGGFSNE